MDSFEVSSSSLSSNGTIEYCNSVLSAFDQEYDLLLQMYANNSLLLGEYLDDEENDAQSHRRGAIPGHIFVYQDREVATHNLVLFFPARSLSLHIVLTRPIIRVIFLFT